MDHIDHIDVPPTQKSKFEENCRSEGIRKDYSREPPLYNGSFLVQTNYVLSFIDFRNT